MEASGDGAFSLTTSLSGFAPSKWYRLKTIQMEQDILPSLSLSLSLGFAWLVEVRMGNKFYTVFPIEKII